MEIGQEKDEMEYLTKDDDNNTSPEDDTLDYILRPLTDTSEQIEGEQEKVEMEDLTEDDDNSTSLYEDTLKEIIKDGSIDDISDILTPKALTKCDTNALLMSMEVNFMLRRLADAKGPSEEEFIELANSVDQFTCCLIDPLKSNTEARHVFGDSLDYIMDAGINWKQKKFFAHPVLYSLMNDKWLGKFGKMKKCSWFTVQRWFWFFLNIWCIFDLVMFPFLFALFYIKHHLNNRNKLRDIGTGIHVTFLLNATSKCAEEAFAQMKKSIEKFIETHGDKRTQYKIVIHGNDSAPREIRFQEVKELERGTAKFPALHEDLNRIDKKSTNSSSEVIIFFTDHKTSIRRKRKQVKTQVDGLEGIKLVPVGIGPHIDIRELEKITSHGYNVIHVGKSEKPDTVRKRIWHELKGQDIYELYLEYFTTPYFIFVRDTLSYLILLGLHFAICFAPSSIPFTGIEWVILIFFMGRTLMEGKQFLSEKMPLTKEATTKRNKGLKYKTCGGNGSDQDQRKTRASMSTMLAEKCGKYMSDRWNVLDLITVAIYIVTFLLRMVTWALSTSVINNRSLVIAGYLYGLNTMFLTLRAFGHVMETIKGVGAIQIALFDIFGDLTAIFWQFIATILAFSIAITKVYVSEQSFMVRNTQNLACKTSGISCWWVILKHLTWSLLGIAELDPLDSVDIPSVTLAHFLFGMFLVMGVILLVNMMIALLSNTYQRVQDNSLMEWSFKKAITIQTYSSYHPIPVPLNLISFFWLLCRWCIGGCKRQAKDDYDEENARRKSLDDVVKNLQVKYVARHGYYFPVTDDSKVNQILQETQRNQQMANQIAYRTFTTHAFDQGALPSGQEAWDTKGMAVDGCLLTCQGEETCGTCKEHGPVDIHGARYRVPFSQEFPHFKVLIQESGEKRFMAVGVVYQNYGSHTMPGWKHGTVGYLVDEGKIFGPFHPVDPTVGKEYDHAIAQRGDVIGCTVKWDGEGEAYADGKVGIVFTLNGKQITKDEIVMEYNPYKKIYPYICMGHTGMTVLAKMTSSKSDSPQLLVQSVTSVTEAAANITHTLDSNFTRVESMFQRLKDDLDKSHKEEEKLMENIITGLEILDHFIQGRFEEGVEDLQRMEGLQVVEHVLLTESEMLLACCEDVEHPAYDTRLEDVIGREHAEYLSTMDGGGLSDLQPTTDLLKKSYENLLSVENNTSDRFGSVFRWFESLEHQAHDDTITQQRKNTIQQKLCQLQECLRARHNTNSAHLGSHDLI